MIVPSTRHHKAHIAAKKASAWPAFELCFTVKFDSDKERSTPVRLPSNRQFTHRLPIALDDFQCYNGSALSGFPWVRYHGSAIMLTHPNSSLAFPDAENIQRSDCSLSDLRRTESIRRKADQAV
jgi:hypothetical protein